ncbi:protein adenylyltransferase SelO [Novispirillum itersonii]|uniref:Protein nucleotidyltransferase YdiU n=1 Tax=Novispirillum itersonii TaxID=189 RepID=A0A7W9ZC76_NOVIT|nr:YdiU family protein [Novispirillum itersonii]MBB6208746.1 uncharacterized protein YdiU (UPF0061 family) [Novispirillum itersonii]
MPASPPLPSSGLPVPGPLPSPGGWRFDTTYLSLPERLYVRQAPLPVRDPHMALFNQPLAEALGLDLSALPEPDLARLLSGTSLPPGATPLAQAYAGHQFGHFTLLGDGRAILLGEHLTPDGQRVDLQLKGSGRTPFSRRGDGRAALGPMLREFILSEAMHALRIPTTRSLAVTTTGEAVLRDDVLPGAVLVRTAASHIRVGTFEFAAAHTDRHTLESLIRYTLARHYPGTVAADAPVAEAARALLEAVIDRQCSLITHWLRVGFIHGVMNTDNMTLSGETIDYGPCAFLDAYDPATVFSSIDRGGRYAFGNQPAIARWNLARLAETLLPVLAPPHAVADGTGLEWVHALFDSLPERFDRHWQATLADKFGLPADAPRRLITAGLEAMQADEADYTNTFAALTDAARQRRQTGAATVPACPFLTPALTRWYADWATAPAAPDQADRMAAANPRRIPRNHQVEAALTAATDSGDLRPLHRLLAALATPYQDAPEHVAYTLPPQPQERVYQTFCGT